LAANLESAKVATLYTFPVRVTAGRPRPPLQRRGRVLRHDAGQGPVAVSPSGKLWFAPVAYLNKTPLSSWDLPASL